jgi:glycine/D-amino acid oxidase-like deaminating enzyme
MGYGADEIYTRMSMRSLALWKEHFPAYFHRTGVLWIAREDHAYSLATRDTLRRAGVRTEILSARDLAARYPQIEVHDSQTFGILEPDSGALMARRAVAAVVQDAIRMGVTFLMGQVDDSPDAAVYVYACGPWLPKLFPELLGSRIFPTRQEVYFFAPPAGDLRYAPPALPVWFDYSDPRGPYGIPDLESRGFKLSFDRHGPSFDPDTGDRLPTAEGMAEARRFLAQRFPGLRDAPLTETRVCQYENTSNGDFLIDRHPDAGDVWLVGGGSGHGFKHGPAVGEYVAGRILKGREPEPRFSLASKAERQSRTVF